MVKNPPANAQATGDVGLIPGLGRPPGEGNGNSLKYSWTEDPGRLQLELQRVGHNSVMEHTGIIKVKLM